MDGEVKFEEFFVEGSDHEASHVILRITEPSADTEMGKGHFFALCDVSQATPDDTQALETLLEEAALQYYQYEGAPEQSLEHALDIINKKQGLFLKPYLKLECVVGALAQTTFLCGYHGRPTLLVLYGGKDGYKTLDLFAGNAAEEPQNGAIFSQVIQGRLNPGDYIFIASRATMKIVDAEQLKHIITTRSPKESSQLLERSLRGPRRALSYGGIIMHCTRPLAKPPQLIKPGRTPRGSAESLRELFATEEKTKATLSSSLGSEVTKKLHATLARDEYDEGETNYVPPRVRERVNQEYERTAAYERRKGLLIRILKALGRGALVVLSALGRFAQAVFVSIRDGFFIAINYRGQRNALLTSRRREIRGYGEHLWRLPLSTKILFTTVLVAAGVFVGGYLHIQKKERLAAAEAQFTNAVKTIETSLASAESVLLYNNTPAARQELTAVETAFNTLDCSEGRAEICTQLRSKIEQLSLKVRKVTVTEPSEITTLDPFFTTEQSGMVKINTTLLIFSPNTSTITAFNLLTNEQKQLATPATTGFVAAAVPKESDFVLFITTDQRLIRYTPNDTTFRALSFSFPSSSVMVSAVVYNRRLYTLDKNNGQLWRFEAIRAGYGAGTSWIKSAPLPTGEAHDVAIDGDIFITTEQGKVRKFANGLEQAFPQEEISPALASAVKIWTYQDMTFNYLLDTAEKRLVVTDKTGRLVKQITTTAFNAPSDMVIDEVNKTAYIVDGSKVLKIGL